MPFQLGLGQPLHPCEPPFRRVAVHDCFPVRLDAPHVVGVMAVKGLVQASLERTKQVDIGAGVQFAPPALARHLRMNVQAPLVVPDVRLAAVIHLQRVGIEQLLASRRFQAIPSECIPQSARRRVGRAPGRFAGLDHLVLFFHRSWLALRPEIGSHDAGNDDHGYGAVRWHQRFTADPKIDRRHDRHRLPPAMWKWKQWSQRPRRFSHGVLR